MEQGGLAGEYIRSISVYLRRYLIPGFGAKSLRDINEGTLEDFLLDLPDHLSAKTRQNIMGILHKILADARRRQDIGRVPEFPKIEVPEPEIKWLTMEEQDQILSQMKEPVRSFFLFCMRNWVSAG